MDTIAIDTSTIPDGMDIEQTIDFYKQTGLMPYDSLKEKRQLIIAKARRKGFSVPLHINIAKFNKEFISTSPLIALGDAVEQLDKSLDELENYVRRNIP